jgi:hypothetical protein
MVSFFVEKQKISAEELKEIIQLIEKKWVPWLFILSK